MIDSKSYGLQNETRQYLRRLYSYGRELNLSDVADIDNFIKGLKQLGLWQHSVSWLLGGKHNIGSGSTALSMGGQASILTDGSLINGPAWNDNGIQFTRSLSTYLQTQPLQLLPRSVFCWALFYSTTSASTAEQFILQQGNNTNSPYPGWWLQLLTNFVFAFSNQQLTSLAYLSRTYNGINRWSYGSGTRINNFSQVNYENSIGNVTSLPSSTGVGYTTSTRAVTIGNSLATPARGFDGRIAACGFVSSSMNNDTSSLVRSLLRTTVGKGIPFN